MNAVEYSSVNLPKSLVKLIDRMLKEHSYASRAEFVKDAIRRRIEELKHEFEITPKEKNKDETI